MEFDVLVTARAEADLQALGDWLHERSPDGARRWTNAASAALTGLRENPRRHSFAPENDHSDREIRNALFKTRRGRVYRAIFYIGGNTVVVTHIRGPHQRPVDDKI